MRAPHFYYFNSQMAESAYSKNTHFFSWSCLPPGTLERYETSLKHTKEFLQWKYSVSDFDINEIDHAFPQKFPLQNQFQHQPK